MEDTLITSIDLPVAGNAMWISDAGGGITHLDLREDKSKARWYQVSNQKVGSVSINPAAPHYLVTASNSRTMRCVLWSSEEAISLMNGQDMGCSQTTSHAAQVTEQSRESQRLRSRLHQRIYRVAQGKELPSCGMETRQIRQRSILGSSWKIYCQHKLRRLAAEFVCLSVS